MTVLQAAHVLRSHPVFRNTSLRHLTDLVELSRPEVQVLGFGARLPVQAAFVALLRGGARVPPILLTPGDVLWTGMVAILNASLRPEVATMLPSPRSFVFVLEDFPVTVEATAAEKTLVLPLTVHRLREAANASTSFGRSVDLKPFTGQDMTLTDFFAAHPG